MDEPCILASRSRKGAKQRFRRTRSQLRTARCSESVRRICVGRSVDLSEAVKVAAHPAAAKQTEVGIGGQLHAFGRSDRGTNSSLDAGWPCLAVGLGTPNRPVRDASISIHEASANGRRQHGQWRSKPFTSAVKADGCGSVMIALYANGARWA